MQLTSKQGGPVFHASRTVYSHFSNCFFQLPALIHKDFSAFRR